MAQVLESAAQPSQGGPPPRESGGLPEESPNMLVYRKMEDTVKRMQEEDVGVPVRTVKGFMTKIPSVFTGADIIQWLMKNLSIEDQAEALHLGSLIAAHGYFFPISEHVLTLKDDGTFYRFQTPYFWPSNCWEPENMDYAVYLCKRTLQNKSRSELADYEAESLARLQQAFARKWEFIVMQSEAQAKIDRKREKVEKKITESQERAFWDVHRPVPGCVNTTEVDMKKSCRIRDPHRTRKDECTGGSPPPTPPPDAKKPTMDELRRRVEFLNTQLNWHCMKTSKVAESLIGYSEQYMEYDAFLTPTEPSNPWQSDDPTFWDMEISKEPSQQQVRRWGFSFDEVLHDPAGQDRFLRFLQSEFSSENLEFWQAVQELKRRPLREVPEHVQRIWEEFLAPGALNSINLDSHSFERTAQNICEPCRYTFEDAQGGNPPKSHAQCDVADDNDDTTKPPPITSSPAAHVETEEHIYKLMKSDSYGRFLRSPIYQEVLLTRKKSEYNQDRRTSFEKFTRNVKSMNLF